ncbi:hypothetical protein BDZ90DRAFT_50861 [Jaminaea rosea]|uniref:Uncharacterized protein n=1 Tax=Jaminaea rosea TaxID=1569628 RepID=A0A316ULW8_9BASI|nr:hypothetical protein BDZ90DRAFT_50861 [Jaminaea rosea]PWN26276.1 hypothetical protein BDZ90DRAFT_50861 [Jaminaea rosea]
MTVPGGPAAAKAPAINGHHAAAPRSEAGNSPTPTTTSSKKEALTDAAESTAALAAIRIVEHPPSPSANPSPISRALAKRVKAITKKLQRIAQYEDLPPAQLNEDQKKAIASRSAQQTPNSF